jgi:hypothetical protein
MQQLQSCLCAAALVIKGFFVLCQLGAFFWGRLHKHMACVHVNIAPASTHLTRLAVCAYTTHITALLAQEPF